MGPWSARSRGQQCVHRCKGVRPGVRLENRSGEPVRSPKNTSGKIVSTLLRRPRNNWNCFRTIILLIISVFTEQLHICEECDSFHDRTGRPFVEGQSNQFFVPSVMKKNVPLNDDLAQEEDLLQRNMERIEKWSQQDRVSKFCTDAGFLSTVGVGQYFMTKDTEELSQFIDSVACREYTLPRDEIIWTIKLDSREHPDWTRIVKYGVEIRFESMNKEWVRISHGLNKLVTNLNDKEQETSEMQFEDYALRLNASVFASGSKSQSKTTKTYFCQLIHKTIPIGERIWTDIEPQDYSLTDCCVEETDQSSSSWESTSRRRWSDWTLEIKRLS